MRQFCLGEHEKAETICSRYANGESLGVLGEEFGVSTATIAALLRRNGCEVRPSGGACFSGEASPRWKGADAKYSALHARLYRHRGRPSQCSVCGTREAKYFDYANLTGNYACLDDYAPMCRRCHRNFDAANYPLTRDETGRFVPARQEGG